MRSEPLAESNKAFWRSLHGITHDVSIAAILTLLLNDHLLRVLFPSWLTGKLGDFAWLVFAPFICAAAFSWIIGGRSQERVVGIAAFGFIGIWFALAKTTPLVHQWTMEILNYTLGYQGTIRIDRTDLLTLPALLIGWRVWRSVKNHPGSLKPRAWGVIALGLVATVATSSAEEIRGVSVLCQDNGREYAFEYSPRAAPNHQGYASNDGGLTWEDADSSIVAASCFARTIGGENGFPESEFQANGRRISDGKRLYQITPTDQINSSLDNGRTWTLEIDLSGLPSEGRNALYRKTNPFGATNGPVDALISAQHNLILAMGTEGLLVRTPDGVWRWAPAGQYRHEQFGLTDHFAVVGIFYFLVAEFAWLAALTIGRPFTISGKVQLALLTAAWILTALCRLLIGLDLIGFPAILIFEISMTIASYKKIRSIPSSNLVTVCILSVLAGTLYLLPLVLWTYGTVPTWPLAELYGFALGAGAVASSRVYVVRKYPKLFNARA